MRAAFLAAIVLLTTSADAQMAVFPPMPQPATVAPNAPSSSPSAGTAATYMRSDAVVPSIVRAQRLTTANGGIITPTWATLPTTAVVQATPETSSTAAYVCQITVAPTTTGATIKCGSSTVNTLGGTPTITGVDGIVIDVTATSQVN